MNTAREPKTWKVEKRDGGFFVVGLPSWGDPDMLLTCISLHAVGGVRPDSHNLMRVALHDLYNCAEGLTDGDRFETPFGNFKCSGVHVVSEVK